MKHLLLVLLGLAGLGLIFLAPTGPLIGVPGARGQPRDPLSPTPTPAPPPGILAPLGRYEERPSSLRADAPAAPSLLSTVQAPSIATDFDGIGMEVDSDGFIHTPPDTHAAVGPDRIVEVTNGHVAIYSKTGSVIAGGDSGAGAVDLNAFCSGEDNGCFDPKVIYDQESGRFVAVVLEVGSTPSPSTSFMHVMVSKNSAPGNLTTDWDKFRQAANATINSTDGWFDYPGLGVSPDAVVVTGNIFSTVGLLLGGKIRVYDKAELYDGDAIATFSDIDATFVDGGGLIQPAHHFGSPPASTFYLLQRWNTVRLRVVALTGVPGSPSVEGFLLPTSDQGDCVDSAPQQGTSKLVDTLCLRMMNAVWSDGSLWGTLTGSDSTDSRAVVQWFEVETNNFPSSSPTLRQHGTIDGGTGEFTFMPSITVDSCGNAATTYTQSSSTRFPEMRYTGRLAGDTLNTMQTPVVAKTSVGFHDDFSSGPERWGDYSATAIDPSDQSFWIAHEYVKVAASGGGNNGRWGTWLANFDFSCILTSTAAFTVNKDFSDNNTANVTVGLVCTSGTVVNDDTAASEADPANFTVNGFTVGATCTATETVPTGYTANQTACAGVAITPSGTPSCTIINTLIAAKPAVVRGNAWHLRNSLTAGAADISYPYGKSGDTKLMCDWDGDEVRTPGVVRGNTWHLRNSNSGGVADTSFPYGQPGDTKVCGDWNGNGTETAGVVRGNIWHLRNSNTGGVADISFPYGIASDTKLACDWNGNGTDTPGVVRGNTWHLRNSNTGGVADISFPYGIVSDTQLVWK